jgi:hypothetical protein
MDHTDDVESVPWSELLDVTDPSDDRRRIAYMAAGLVGAVVLGAVIARAWWSPSAPTIIAPASTVAAPAEDAVTTTVATLPLYSEADLMADPPDPGARAAVMRAEWFVSDYFTADYEPTGSGDVRAALPGTAELPEMPQDGLGGISYVEWARAYKVEEVGDGTYLVSVAFRTLAAPPDGSFVRLGVRAVEIHVDVLGDGAAILDLPRPVAVPVGPDAGPWPGEAAEPPTDVVDVAAARASVWGMEPRIVSSARIDGGWRIITTIADDVGNRWPVSIIVEG